MEQLELFSLSLYQPGLAEEAEFQRFLAYYRELTRPWTEAAERSSMITANDLNILVRRAS